MQKITYTNNMFFSLEDPKTQVDQQVLAQKKLKSQQQ